MRLPPSYCLVKEYKPALQAVAEISGVGSGGRYDWVSFVLRLLSC